MLKGVEEGHRFVCPRHKCAGCGKGQSEYTGSQGRMIRCIACPFSYHFKCIPSHGYVEYPDPITSIICDHHAQEVRMFREQQVKAALSENKIEAYDTAGVGDAVMKECMDNMQLMLPEAWRVPARMAAARTYGSTLYTN